MQIPSPAYWQRLREICDKHGVLLIADEVINGWGRSGKYFAMEHMNVVPDMMTMAKGLSSGYAPIGAVAVRPSVFEGFKEKGDVALGHLLTFGGQAVACAAALKNIEIFKDEDLVQQSADKGEYMLKQLNELRSHPTVGDVRGLGLMLGVEIVKNKDTKEKWGREHEFVKRASQHMNEQGLLARVWDIIHVAPPFVITTDGDGPHRLDHRRVAHRRRERVRQRDRQLGARSSQYRAFDGRPSPLPQCVGEGVGASCCAHSTVEAQWTSTSGIIGQRIPLGPSS